MSEAPAFVLDASALLTYLQGEPGATVVASALVQGSNCLCSKARIALGVPALEQLKRPALAMTLA